MERAGLVGTVVPGKRQLQHCHRIIRGQDLDQSTANAFNSRVKLDPFVETEYSHEPRFSSPSTDNVFISISTYMFWGF